MITEESLATWAEQLAIDRCNTDTRYTGIEWDGTTEDWICWLDGRVMGWAPTRTAGELLLANERRLAAHAKGWTP